MNEGKFEAKAARSQRDIAVAAGTFAQFSGSASWDTHTLSTDADPTCNDLALQSATNVAPNSPMPVPLPGAPTSKGGLLFYRNSGRVFPTRDLVTERRIFGRLRARPDTRSRILRK